MITTITACPRRSELRLYIGSPLNCTLGGRPQRGLNCAILDPWTLPRRVSIRTHSQDTFGPNDPGLIIPTVMDAWIPGLNDPCVGAQHQVAPSIAK